MILGRPTNLWLGAATALLNAGVLVLAATGTVLEPQLVAALNLALAAIITLVAGQPPTVKEGGTFKVVTPNGDANELRTA